MVDSQIIPLAGQEFPSQPVNHPRSSILQILSEKDLFIKRIVKTPKKCEIWFGKCMCSTCCFVCFPLALLESLYWLCDCASTLKAKVPKFLVKDDLLEVKTYPHTIWPCTNGYIEKMKIDLICVKFYRTVQTPYSQTITLVWTEEHEDDKGNISIKGHTFCLQVQATIIEHSNHKIVLKVDAFDDAEKGYKLLYQSEYTLEERDGHGTGRPVPTNFVPGTLRLIFNKEKWSNIGEILRDRDGGDSCSACFKYHEFEFVTEFGYSN